MLQDIYYNKYIKYKTKYLQLAGNYKNNNNLLDTNRCIEDNDGIFVNLSDCIANNIWKDNYIELYNILLNVVSNPNIILTKIIPKIQSLCILLFENLTLVYNNSSITNAIDKRIINYNMRFIINIVSMIIDEPFVSSINDKVKIQFNKEQSLDKNNFYYLEDALTNDLDLFFSEYDKLINDKKSIFFYRSNLVNISILLKCFSDKCIEQKINSDKTNEFYDNLYKQFTSDDFKNINKNFSLNKYSMIKLLLESYSDFSYEKVKNLYIEYLKFHYENFKNLDMVNLQKDELEQSFQRLNELIGNSGTDYFIYLSCNLPSEFKFQKFEATKILISYLGFRENSDNFYNSIDIIDHDFGNTHDQYKRKVSYTTDELLNLRAFFKLLYESFKSDQIMLEEIVILIHILNYESNTAKLNIIKFIQQLSQKFIFEMSEISNLIIDYIKTYLLNWPELVNGDEEVRETNKIIELLKDKLFRQRLFYNLQVKLQKIKLLEQDDKNLLIKYINKVVENKGILDEIKNFLFDSTYTLDLSKDLNPNQILLIKKIIRKTNNIDVIYIFISFLYKNYKELFGNNKIYENLTTLLN